MLAKPMSIMSGCASTYTIQSDILRAVSCRFESGNFFALDMGGTNFRTVYVKLSDKHGEMVMLPANYCNRYWLLLITVLPGACVQAAKTDVSPCSSAHVCLCR